MHTLNPQVSGSNPEGRTRSGYDSSMSSYPPLSALLQNGTRAECGRHGVDALAIYCEDCGHEGRILERQGWDDERRALQQRIRYLERKLAKRGASIVRADLNGSMVYFLQRQDGLIKIGRSVNVQKRIVALECSAGPLVLLASIPGGVRVEAKLHERFEEARKFGEWFQPTPGLLALINESAA
jgi:hypothetical protein